MGTNASACEQKWLEFKRVICLGMENLAPSKRVSQQRISLGRGRNLNLHGDLLFNNNRSPSPKAEKCRVRTAVKEFRVGRNEVPSGVRRRAALGAGASSSPGSLRSLSIRNYAGLKYEVVMVAGPGTSEPSSPPLHLTSFTPPHAYPHCLHVSARAFTAFFSLLHPPPSAGE